MCYNPINVRMPGTDPNGHALYKQVPCGKCLECRKAYQQQWIIRITESFKASKRVGTFFTLTYNEDSIPVNFVFNGQVFRSAPGYSRESKGNRGEHSRDREPAFQSVLDYVQEHPELHPESD